MHVTHAEVRVSLHKVLCRERTWHVALRYRVRPLLQQRVEITNCGNDICVTFVLAFHRVKLPVYFTFDSCQFSKRIVYVKARDISTRRIERG